jgi:hypothetical protein
MMGRHVRVAILILLAAMCAFVMDVLSPVTPTPTAQFVAKSFVIGLLSLVFISFQLRSLEPPVQRIRFYAESPSVQPNPRMLLMLISVLLV